MWNINTIQLSEVFCNLARIWFSLYPFFPCPNDIIVFSENSEAKELCHELETLFPGQVEFRLGFPDKQPLNEQFYIVVGDNPNLEDFKHQIKQIRALFK